VDKYTWVDKGSSYVPADILAAFLLTQLQHMAQITQQRRRVYERYLAALQPLAARGLLTLPTIPTHCAANYHMFYAIADSLATRTALLDALKAVGILAVFHYVPLHTAPVGRSLGYEPGTLPVTESISDRLLRLPLYPALSNADVDEVVRAIYAFYRVHPPAEHAA
jgi:dTDP-4-amino-4,6-dideoxygalactose transaminase